MENKRDIFDKVMALPGLRRLETPYRKHKAVLLYLFFGVLTTAVSIGSFMGFTALGMDALIANVPSWILAVSFAYVTNRVWVFRSEKTDPGDVLKEMGAFYGGRVLTLGFEEWIVLVFITWLGFDSTLVKLLAQVAVLVLNYLVSKVMVFRKKATGKN